MSGWQADLFRAASAAKCRFSSLEVIDNEAHARTAIALFKAFGQDAACSILPEARTPDRLAHENARPADVLILHPELGVLFVEVKGWMLGDITGINAGTVCRDVNGYQVAKDPWNQVANASQQLQNATRRTLRQRKLPESEAPFFDCIVAFPNISRAGWAGKGYGESLSRYEVLFAEDLAKSEALRSLLIGRLKAKAGHRLPCSRAQIDNVRWALGDTDVISHKRPRGRSAGKLSEVIDIAELQQNRFSAQQQELANAEWEGRPQLVRGVAGSGKTAVLVKNLANMLDRKSMSEQLRFDRDTHQKRFLIVCFNRSLVPLLRQKFEDAYRELTYQDPPKCVDIFHMNGLQYAFCKASRKALQYYPWKPSDRVDDSSAQRFAANYCQQLDTLASVHSSSLSALQYDSIYIDEGQDFFMEEFQLLTRLARPDPNTGEKNIVIFYDDAQNLYGRPRPTWLDLGLEVRGRAAVMRTCLRNPRQVVEFAFNLLLGVAAESRVLTREFADIRSLKDDALVEELPDRWLVHFAPRTDGELPKVVLFQTREIEIEWIVAKLDELINGLGISPEDVLLVSKDPKEFLALESRLRVAVPKIKRILKPWGKSSNPDKDAYILEEGAITLATVGAAKGYDCPIVLLIGADLFQNSVKGRASFYVAATRAKMRLFVTGLKTIGTLAEESEKVAALLAAPPKPVASPLPAAIAYDAGTNLKPFFRAGDMVMQLGRNNQGKKVGRVVSDAVTRKQASTQTNVQDVQVEFDGKIVTLTLPFARLQLVPARAES